LTLSWYLLKFTQYYFNDTQYIFSILGEDTKNKNMINITPEAATAVQNLLAQQEQEDAALRIYITGVG